MNQNVPIDDVVLDVEAVEPVEEGAEHGDELHAVLGLGENLRGDLLVEEDASGDAAGVQLRDGLEHRRRPVGVGAVAAIREYIKEKAQESQQVAEQNATSEKTKTGAEHAGVKQRETVSAPEEGMSVSALDTATTDRKSVV